MIASIDWAHMKPLCCNVNGKGYEVLFNDMVIFLKEHNIDTIVGENIPSKLLLLLLEHNTKVYRCGGTHLADYRKSLGFEKESDEKDAEFIIGLYQKNPELFYEYTKNDKKFIRAKHLYKLRESIQKSRLQYENKLNAYKNFYMFDDDILNKISQIHKELLSKERYLNGKFDTIYFKKYMVLFEDIKGIGAVSIAHIVSEIGDINRFINKKHFLNYVFGYSNSNYNHRLKTRFLMLVDSMFKQGNEYYTTIYYNYKNYLLSKHTNKIVVDGKTKYNPNHINNLSKRRVARKIAELFYKRLKLYSENDKGIPRIKDHYTKRICIAKNITEI